MLNTPASYCKQKGFSLLEILVAFSILAMSLGVILKIFSGGLQSAMLSEEYIHAVTIAESLLAQTGVDAPLQEQTTNGEELQKYNWRVQVSPYVMSELPETEGEQLFQLYQVSVEVTWDDGANERSVLLHTLRLASNQ